MRALLQHLKPGTRFRVDDRLGQTGVLVKANECRALVRLDAPVETVEFVDRQGATHEFVRHRSRETSWSPNVLVIPLGWEELKMAKKTESKTTKTTKAPKAKAEKTAKGGKAGKAKTTKAAKTDGKLSALDAAAKVLAEAKEPLSTRQMIEAMTAKGYWTSPGGATPHATLYSAIAREINEKGAESRFKKTDRGRFGLKG